MTIDRSIQLLLQCTILKMKNLHFHFSIIFFSTSWAAAPNLNKNQKKFSLSLGGEKISHKLHFYSDF